MKNQQICAFSPFGLGFGVELGLICPYSVDSLSISKFFWELFSFWFPSPSTMFLPSSMQLFLLWSPSDTVETFFQQVF
jgi:hypothetical protein